MTYEPKDESNQLRSRHTPELAEIGPEIERTESSGQLSAKDGGISLSTSSEAIAKQTEAIAKLDQTPSSCASSDDGGLRSSTSAFNPAFMPLPGPSWTSTDWENSIRDVFSGKLLWASQDCHPMIPISQPFQSRSPSVRQPFACAKRLENLDTGFSYFEHSSTRWNNRSSPVSLANPDSLLSLRSYSDRTRASKVQKWAFIDTLFQVPLHSNPAPGSISFDHRHQPAVSRSSISSIRMASAEMDLVPTEISHELPGTFSKDKDSSHTQVFPPFVSNSKVQDSTTKFPNSCDDVSTQVTPTLQQHSQMRISFTKATSSNEVLPQEFSSLPYLSTLVYRLQ